MAPKPRSVRLSEATDAALVAKARELDRSVSWVVQRAVEQYLGAPGRVSDAERQAVAETVPAPDPSRRRPVAPRSTSDPMAARQAALNKTRGL